MKSYFLSIALRIWKNEKRKFAWRNRIAPAIEANDELLADTDEKYRLPLLLYYMEELSVTKIASDSLSVEIQTFVASLTAENLEDYAKPISSTKIICVPDADGVFDYSFDLSSGAATNGTDVISTLFPDNITGVKKIGSYSYSEGLSDLLIDTFILNEDGTVTSEVYTPILQE